MKKIIGNLFLLIVFIFPMYVFADVFISETEDRGGRIVISGNITPSDYGVMLEKHALLKREKRTTSFIFLDSLGGDVETAIKIGRYVRKEGFHAIVHKGRVCASSCVLVLAGAKVKDTYDGAIYVHRPFVNNDNEVNPANQKKRYKRIEKTIKAYLEEMNIPVTLYDEMFSIDSMSAKRLSIDELKKYGLIGMDPYVAEANAARKAKELGITKSELHGRYNRLNVLCNEQYDLMHYAYESSDDRDYQKGKTNEYEECSNKVMNGELR